MDLYDLTPEQAAAIVARLRPMLGYLGRLSDRMQKRGWDSGDRLYRKAWEARDALHEMCVALHYHSLGRGRPGNPPPPAMRPVPPPVQGPRPPEVDRTRDPWGGGRQGA